MRSVLFLAVFVTLAAPSAASAKDATAIRPETRLESLADALNDPATQAAMASSAGAVMGAVLDIRIDKVAKALEPLNGGKSLRMKGNTVRDLAARDDPDFDRKMERNARTAVESAGAMAKALAVMLPELEKAAKKMGEALPQRR